MTSLKIQNNQIYFPKGAYLESIVPFFGLFGKKQDTIEIETNIGKVNLHYTKGFLGIIYSNQDGKQYYLTTHCKNKCKVSEPDKIKPYDIMTLCEILDILDQRGEAVKCITNKQGKIDYTKVVMPDKSIYFLYKPNSFSKIECKRKKIPSI